MSEFEFRERKPNEEVVEEPAEDKGAREEIVAAQPSPEEEQEKVTAAIAEGIEPVGAVYEEDEEQFPAETTEKPGTEGNIAGLDEEVVLLVEEGDTPQPKSKAQPEPAPEAEALRGVESEPGASVSPAAELGTRAVQGAAEGDEPSAEFDAERAEPSVQETLEPEVGAPAAAPSPEDHESFVTGKPEAIAVSDDQAQEDQPSREPEAPVADAAPERGEEPPALEIGGGGERPPDDNVPPTNGEDQNEVNDQTSEGSETSETNEFEELRELGPVVEVDFDWDDTWVDVGLRLRDHHLALWKEEHRRDHEATESEAPYQEAEPPREFADKALEVTGRKGEEVMKTLWPDKSDEDRSRLLGRFRELVKADPNPAEPIEDALEAQRRLIALQDSLPEGYELRLNLLTGRSVGLSATADATGIPLDRFNRIRAQGEEGEAHESYATKSGALKADVELGDVPADSKFIVGDGVSDMAAGRRSGIQRIGIPRHGASAEQLMEAGAERTFATLIEFVDWFEGYLKYSYGLAA